MSILQIFTSHSTAAEKPLMTIDPLISALKSIDNPVCEIAATKLLSSLKNGESDYDLHLRNADLSTDDVKLIAEAIQAVHNEGGPFLRSFSMSYNPNLSDEGVLVLVAALPPTLTEIGLVRCNIGDQGGNALIAWASQAPKLHWLCIEENAFSNKTKDRLITFGQERAGLLVVV